jgi:hypothetical protein
MKVKVFESNQKGKVEFTRAELEKLLNEIYMDGYREGEAHARSSTWTWTTPCYDYATTAITGDSTSSNTISIASKDCADGTLASKSASLGTTTIDSAKANNADAVLTATPKITTTSNSLHSVEDFIAKLAKELNF